MQKKLTITLDEQVYIAFIPPSDADASAILSKRSFGRMSSFPILMKRTGKMAQQEDREADALEWAEATVCDVADEPVQAETIG